MAFQINNSTDQIDRKTLMFNTKQSTEKSKSESEIIIFLLQYIRQKYILYTVLI